MPDSRFPVLKSPFTPAPQPPNPRFRKRRIWPGFPLLATLASCPLLGAEFPLPYDPALWLDASDAASVTESGGKVSTWADKSGNGHDYAQATAGNQPALVADAVNAKPGISFDGADDFLGASSRLGLGANPNLMVFMVTVVDADVTTDSRILHIGNSSMTLAVGVGSDGWAWRYDGGNERYGAVAKDKAAIQCWERAAGSDFQAAKFYLDGTELSRTGGATDGGLPADTTANSSIGGKFPGAGALSNQFSGKIGEIVVLELSDATARQEVEGYLAHKWGLAVSLPDGHPHKDAPPSSNLPPTIALVGEASIQVPFESDFTDPGVTATDTEDGDLTGDSITITYEAWVPPDPIAADTYPGLKLWLKGDEGFSPGGWADQSGNGNDAAAHGNPEYVEDGLNGLPVMRYSGANGESHRFARISDIRTIFWVVKRNNNAFCYLLGDSSAFHFHTPDAGNRFWHGSHAHANVKNGRLAVDGTTVNGLQVNIPSEMSVISLRTTGNVQAESFSQDRNIGRNWNGDLAELLIYNTALADEEIQDIETRLAVKWDLPFQAKPTPLDTLDTSILGDWTAIYSATDSGGKTAEVRRAIEVFDPNAPILTLVGEMEMHHELGADYTDPGVTVADKDGNALDAKDLVTTGVVDGHTPGVYELQYDFTDAAGGIADPLFRTVTVSDTTPPVITLLGGDTVKQPQGQPFLDPGATATDNIDGALIARSSEFLHNQYLHKGWDGSGADSTINFLNNGGLLDADGNGWKYRTGQLNFGNDQAFINAGVGIGHGDHFRNVWTGYFRAKVEGEYEFRVQREDERGTFFVDFDQDGLFEEEGALGNEWVNGGYAAGATTVNLKPGFYRFAGGHMEHGSGSSYEARVRTPAGAGPTSLAVINPNQANQKDLWLVSTPVNTGAIGIQTITYTAVDAAGNTTTVTRTIEIIDPDAKPVITLEGRAFITHEQFSDYVDPGYTVADADGNPLDASGVEVTGHFDKDSPGIYELNYIFYDDNGIPADPKVRQVTVSDTTKPVLELVGDAEMTLVQGETFTEPGVTLVNDPEPNLTITNNLTLPSQGLFLHLDASRMGGAAAGEEIGIWMDRSGNGNHLNDVRGNPVLVGDGINGQPAVHLDGDDFMAATGRDIQRTYSIFTVSRLDGNKNHRLISSRNINWLLGYWGGYEDVFHPEGWATATNTAPASTNPHLYSAISNDSQNHVRFWGDGSELTTNNSRDGRIGKLQLAGYQENNNASSGYVAEVILYDNYNVTGPEQLIIRAYLASKYGLLGYPQSTPPDLSVPGEHNILYTATDSAGNIATITRKVTVTPDTTIPVITLEGETNVRLEFDADYTVPDATVQDGDGNDLDASGITINGGIDTAVLGTHVISYDFTSADGVDAKTVYRTLFVEDTTGPAITLTGDEVVRVKVGEAYADAGATALDARDGEVRVFSDAILPPDGMVLHLDAGFFKGKLTDGANIQVAWEDQSGQGNHASNRRSDPHWIEAGLNGLPVVHFDGDDMIWTARDFEPLLANYTLLTVARYTGGDSERVFSSRGRNWIFGFHGNGIRKFHSDGWAHNGSGTDTEWHVHAGDVNNADQANFWLDGVQLATNSTGLSNTSYKPKVLQMGGWEGDREMSKCEVAEVILYNRVLPAKERDLAVHYLNTKYNLNGGGTFASKVDTSAPGTDFITYTATDSLGHKTVVQRKVIVVTDDAKPYIVINGEPEVTVEAASAPAYVDPGAVAYAADGSEANPDLTGQGTVDINTPGTYTLTYSHTDADDLTRTIIVQDSTGPAITLNGDNPMKLWVDQPYVDPGATSLDMLDGDTPAYSDYVSIPDTLRYEYFWLGHNAAYLNFENNGGLFRQNPRLFQYFTDGPRNDGIYFRNDQDFQTLHPGNYRGDDYQVLLSAYFEAKKEGIYEFASHRRDTNDYVTIWLDKDQDGIFSRGGAAGDERITWDITASTVYLMPGSYAVAFGYVERNNNSEFRIRFRTPEGAGPPTLANVNPVWGLQQGLWSSLPYQLDTSVPGVHNLRYFATDKAGNRTTVHRQVIVEEDTEKPIILLIGDRDIDQHAGLPFTEPGYELTDFQGNPLDASQVVVTGVPNGSKTGKFTVRYNFKDADGHIADTQTRTVTVDDTIPPVITLNGANPSTVQKDSVYKDSGALGMDAFDGQVAVFNDASLPSFGLMGWWKFDDGSGTIAKDETGQHDGTLVNFAGSEWVAGKYGGGLDFNRANNNNQHVNLKPFEFGGGFSAAAWVKYTSFEKWSRVIDFGETNGPNAVMFANDNNSATGAFQIRNPANTARDIRIPNFWVLDTWIHVGVTVSDSGIMRMYKDGVEVGTTVGHAPARATRSNYYVGRSMFGGDRRFRGVLDDLIVYDREISAEEIQAIMEGPKEFDTSTVGEYTVTYTAADAHGNTSTVTRTVMVVDEPDLPVISLVGEASVTHGSGSAYEDPGATVADANGIPLDAAGLVFGGNLNTDIPGIYTVTYDFTDGNGNNAVTVVRQVIVTDQSPPVITLVGGDTIYHQLGNRFVDPGFSAVDAVEGAKPVQSSMLRQGKVRVRGYQGGQNDSVLNLHNNGGMFNLTPKATREDYVGGPRNEGIRLIGDGNFRSAIPQITGNDNFQMLFDGQFYTSSGGLYEFGMEDPDDAAAFWMDLDGDGVFENNGDHGTELMNIGYQYGYRQVELEPGYHRYAIAFREGGGHSQVDARFRAISGIGPASLAFINPAWQPTHWVLYDPIDSLTLGEQQITYTTEDSLGNKATVVRTVIVRNNPDAGIITLAGEEEMNLPYNGTYTEPGATVADLEGNALPADQIVITGEVDTSRLGTYKVEYDYTTADGQQSRTRIRTIHVVDDEAPVITLAGDAEMEVFQGSTFTDPGASATDNYDGDTLLVGSSESFPQNGLRLHLDASAIVGKADGDPVTLWYDISGSGHDANIVAGTPTYSATALNGRPAVHFDGESRIGLSKNFWRDYTILTVSQLSGTANQRLLTSRDQNWVLGYISGTENRFHVPNGWVSIGSAPASTRPHLYTAASTGATNNAYFYADGRDRTGISKRANNTMNMGYFQMGAWMDGREGSVGDVAEVILYNRILTESERRGVEARLNAKYGLNGVTATNAPVDTSKLGEFSVVYQTVDLAGNLATAIRKVTVVADPDAPTITLNGGSYIAHEASASYTDAGAVLKDKDGNTLDASLMAVANNVAPTDPGIYEVTYTYVPGAGAPAVPVTRTVEVKDTTPPVITLDGDATIKLSVGEAYTDPGFSAADASTHFAPVFSDLEYISGQLLHQGYKQGRNDAKFNLNNNGGILNDTPAGQSFLTTGPGGRGLDFNGDGDFRAAVPAINRNDNYHNLFSGVFIAPTPGNYEFGILQRDDQASAWVDLDQDGTFESSGDKGNEQVRAVGATGYKTVNLQPGIYKVAFIHQEGGGGSGVHVGYRVPGGARQNVKPGVAAQKIHWATPNTAPLDTSAAGTFHITYTSVDQAGNTATAIRTVVVVEDATLPFISLNGDLEIIHEAGQAFTDPNATVTDGNGDEIRNDLAGQGTVDISTPGEYTLTYDFTDGGGKVAEIVTRKVIVVDTTAPVATLVAHPGTGGTDTVTLIVGTAWEDPGVDIQDADTEAWSVSSRDFIPNRLQVSGYNLTHNNNLVDFDNTTNLFTRNPAGQGPFTNGPRNLGLNFQDDNDFRRVPSGISRGDNFQLLITGYFHAEVDGEYQFRNTQDRVHSTIWIDIGRDGEFTESFDRINWGAQTQTLSLIAGYYRFAFGVTHQNNQAKTSVQFKAPAGARNSAALTTVKPGLPSQAGTWNIKGDGPIGTEFPGTHEITYYVMDHSGNMVTLHRTVNVIPDPDAPILTLNGEEGTAHEVGSAYEDAGVAVSDASGNAITDPLPTTTITHAGQVVTEITGLEAGVFEIQYDFTDSSARKAIPVFRTVTVADTTPPVITLQGGNGPITLPLGVEYFELDATALDAVDGEVSLQVTSSSPVDNRLVPGLSVGEFNGRDLDTPNNKSRGTDPLGPSIAELRDVAPWRDNVTFVYTGEIYDEDGVFSVTESIDDTAFLKINGDEVLNNGQWNNDTVAAVDLGSGGWFPFELRIHNATGGAGLVNPPGFGWDPDGGNNYVVAQNTDYVTMDLFRTRGKAVNSIVSHTEGTQTLTFTATDAAGNKSTVVREILVKDDLTIPVIVLEGETDMILEAGTPFVDPGFQAQDRRGNDLPGEVQIDGVVDHTRIGEYILAYDYTDAESRKAGTLRRNITVVDTTPPVINLTDGEQLRWDIGKEWVEPGYTITDNHDSGLVAEIRFLAEGIQPVVHWEFDETDGTVAYDLMAGLNGTLKNFPDPAAARVLGKYGKSLAFDSTNSSYIEIPGSAILDLQAFTISVWVKTDDYDRSMFLFEKSSNNTVNSQYNLFFENDNTLTYRVVDDISNMYSVSVSSPAHLIPDVWQHIVVTYDGTDQSLFIEGELVASETPEVTLASNPGGKAYIGAHAPGDGYYFHGQIDDLKFYNFAITESQVAQVGKRTGVDTQAEQKVPPYRLQYSTEDGQGNQTTVIREIVVSNDVTPPSIVLLGDTEIELELGAPFTDPGFLASDNVDEHVSAAFVQVEGSVDTSKTGVYTITYSVSDLSFNEAVRTRTVTVIPNPDADPLVTWTNDKLGSLPEPKRDLLADPDHDRVPNLLEYAIGGNPTSPDRKDTLPEVNKDSGSLTVSFLRIKASVDPTLTYKVELTRKLKGGTWSEADVTVTVDADQTGVPADYEKVTAISNTPIANETQKRQFIRITVDRP